MESFDHLAQEDRLKAENEFMKMKMMLEKGAEFHSENNGEELPADLENIFLSNIMEFERQFEQQKIIKIFDKIGRPAQFKPVIEIPDNGMDEAWQKLSDYLHQHGISLDACSPNVSNRELYRFTVEELFDYEITDMNIPGMMQGFIYDEFHPDPAYDNTRAAVEYCIEKILCKEPFDYFFSFRNGRLRLNDHYPLSEEQFKVLLNQFKAAYDDFSDPEISHVDCMIDKGVCQVKGEYKVTAVLSGESIILSGKWFTEFELNQEFGYWYLHTVRIDGIKF